VAVAGARRNATRGFSGRGALQRWPERLGAWGHARRPSELAPIGADCCLADCHSHAAEPPHRVPPRPSVRRQDQPPPQTAGGSASPKGEARREAPARQSQANAAPGRTTGGGGRGGVNKPYEATHPRPAPPTSAAARPVRRTPASRSAEPRYAASCSRMTHSLRTNCAGASSLTSVSAALETASGSFPSKVTLVR